MSPAKLMTRKQAAEHLVVSIRTLDGFTSTGQIPRVKLGARVLYREQDIDEFIESRLETCVPQDISDKAMRIFESA